VAGDPHLPLSLPAQWYVVHMDCPEFTVAGPCNPGYPGPVFYGHNTRVAWTMTHAQADRWDLYRERVRRGARGPEYLFRGEWHEFASRQEQYEVRDGEAVHATTWETVHGPVIFGDPERDDEVIAARWALTEACHDTDAMLDVVHATTAAEAREGFREYDSVSGNFCFADTAGDIGYQYAGRIPKHAPMLVPVPGWDGEHEWDGFVPKVELPAEENPARGYFITANNRTTTPDYPHYLTYMASRFRADRLNELLGAQERFGRQDMRQFQADVTSVGARALAPVFAAAPVSSGMPTRVCELFDGWDGTLAPESAAALAFDAVCEVLTAGTLRAFLARVPVKVSVTPYEERRILIDQIEAGSTLMLPDGAGWPQLIGGAIEEAAAALVSTFGDDASRWRWDARHVMRWRHNLGRQPELADALNLPPVGVGGDGTTPFATTSDSDATVMAGVSYRQILDLADLNGAQICIPPGNSGQPGSPHYADNIDRWRTVEYHPLFIDWGDIEANAEARQELVPVPGD
jgi:penicillin amidase